jgi:RNA polymerase sigma-70 factor (ECF subfamily)
LEVSERKIVQLCKNGSKEGYELLFHKYRHFIYSVCINYVGSKEDAFDLTQEVFIKLYRNFSKFDDSRPLLPWVKRITVNTCLNHTRGSKEPMRMDDLAVTASDRHTPEETVELQATRAELQRAMSELPYRERMAVILRHVQGLSYAAIGETMGCPLGTVKTYIFRGRNILRDKLRIAGILEG